MIRIVAIAAVPLLLGGCLPLPVTIASSAISGISYLTTGKTSTDHVLSAAVEQDCALARSIFGKPLCQEAEPETLASARAVVSHHPGDFDDGVLVSSYDERLNVGAMDLKAAEKGPKQIALVLPFARPAVPEVETPGVVITEDAVVPAPETRPLTVSARSDGWSDPDPVMPVARSIGLRAGGKAANRQVPTDEKSRDLEAAGGVYVVIGSLRDAERADGLAKRFEAMSPFVRQASIQGQTWNRVVVGPFGPGRASQVKASLGEVDGKQPWIVRLDDTPLLATLY